MKKTAWLTAFLLLTTNLEAYERIISLKPNVTEILFALGLGPKVVGDTTFCNYPSEARKVEKIGGYSNPNLEKILTLHPDLVVLMPEATSPRIEAAIRNSGIETLVVRTTTLDEIYDAIHTIAAKTGVAEEGEGLIASMKKKIDVESGRIRGPGKKRVLLVIQRRPLMVASGRTFLGNLLNLAGGENLAKDSKLPYPRFSMEKVLEGRPDVILDLDPTPEEGYWSQFPSLPAVKNNRVALLSFDAFIPGPRIPEALGILIRKIHQNPPIK